MRDVQNRLPIEVAYMESLRDGGSGCANGKVVALSHHTTQWAQMAYRLYMPYYPFGDVTNVMAWHGEDHVPEPFVWWLFEALVEAALCMEQGDLNAAVADWEAIVHRDIKPQNIMLGQPRPGTFQAYPEPKLGDFGLAVVIPENDPLNPKAYNNDVGTHGYQAPEQLQYLDSQTADLVDEVPLNSSTNVWGLGITLLSVMNNDIPPRLAFEDINRSMPRWQDAALYYSPELRNLVMRCVAFRQADRPTLGNLRVEIGARSSTAAPPGVDLAQGMRTFVPVNLDDDFDHKLRLDADEYPLGLALAQEVLDRRGVL